MTSQSLKKQNLIDEIVAEPLGGAHRDVDAMAKSLKAALLSNYTMLRNISQSDLVKRRYTRLSGYGKYSES